MRGAVSLLPPLYIHGVGKDTFTLTTFTIPTKSSDSPQLNKKVECMSFARILNPGRVTAHVSQSRCVLYEKGKMDENGDLRRLFDRKTVSDFEWAAEVST
jgi:hypothetical protein